ncbi:hypothetical protein A2U01_0089906, partial [Trifolium medium]|nr:hypothetical protein [Trifolium medium]
MEHERMKRIEEKRLEEERKRQEEEEAQQKLLPEVVTAHGSDLDKGKAKVSDSDLLVLKLQEDLAAQKAEQELLKEE